jgi:hypothetical protein
LNLESRSSLPTSIISMFREFPKRGSSPIISTDHGSSPLRGSTITSTRQAMQFRCGNACVTTSRLCRTSSHTDVNFPISTCTTSTRVSVVRCFTGRFSSFASSIWKPLLSNAAFSLPLWHK